MENSKRKTRLQTPAFKGSLALADLPEGINREKTQINDRPTEDRPTKIEINQKTIIIRIKQ